MHTHDRYIFEIILKEVFLPEKDDNTDTIVIKKTPAPLT